ncbi:hypothetical protein HRG_013378 [Hirsutella rhossiliensis]
MTAPAQKNSLVRIRDNQRRSRARRREYVQELEQRLRVCELQGIEASTEIQIAARRVAEENKQLRELLNRHGFSDDHVAHFLQSGTFVPLDADQDHPSRAGDPGAAVQSLEQLLVPRRLANLDQDFSLSSLYLPRQSCRDPSTTSGSTTRSSILESSQLTTSSYGYQHHMGMATAVMGLGVQYKCPLITPFSRVSTTRQGSVHCEHPSPSMLDSPGQPMATTQAMFMGDRPAMHLQRSLPTYTYSDSTIPHYVPPGSTSGG